MTPIWVVFNPCSVVTKTEKGKEEKKPSRWVTARRVRAASGTRLKHKESYLTSWPVMV